MTATRVKRALILTGDALALGTAAVLLTGTAGYAVWYQLVRRMEYDWDSG